MGSDDNTDLDRIGDEDIDCVGEGMFGLISWNWLENEDTGFCWLWF